MLYMNPFTSRQAYQTHLRLTCHALQLAAVHAVAMTALLVLCTTGCSNEKSSSPATASSENKPPVTTPESDKPAATPAGDAASTAGKSGAASEDSTTSEDSAAGEGTSSLPASSKTDAREAERIMSEYRSLRGMLSTSSSDRELTSKELAALKQWLGKKDFQKFRKRIEAVDEGETWDLVVPYLWLEHLASDAKRGIVSIVRIPVEGCEGWGSITPSAYTAVGCLAPLAFFVTPTGNTKLLDECTKCWDIEDEERREGCLRKRCTTVAEGYFTGESKSAGRDSPHGPAYEFVIQRARLGERGAMTLRLPGGSPPPDGLVIKDGKKWGVMFADAWMTEKDARARAEATQKKLRDKGFTSAEIMDSRRISTLWCCSHAVVVDRFDQKDEASALATKLEKSGFDDIIVREMY